MKANHGLPVAPRKTRKDATKLTEAQFTTQVIQFARLMGWRVAHFRPAMTAQGWRTAVQGDGAGFPDLVLLRGRALMFWELKVKPNKANKAQLDWIHCLMAAHGVTAHVLYPDDWGWIQETLSSKDRL